MQISNNEHAQAIADVQAEYKKILKEYGIADEKTKTIFKVFQNSNQETCKKLEERLGELQDKLRNLNKSGIKLKELDKTEEKIKKIFTKIHLVKDVTSEKKLQDKYSLQLRDIKDDSLYLESGE